MYHVNYRVYIEKTPNTERGYTELNARFRFNREVAPKDVKNVKARISTSPPSKLREMGEVKNIRGYLLKRFCYSENEDKFYKSSGIDIWIKTKVSFACIIAGINWGFNLSAIANGNIPLEEIIDLDALNHFILTGKIEKQEK